VSNPQIELWYTYGSPYSYLAVERIESLAASAGVAIAWRPFILGPIFQALHGSSDSPFSRNAPRGSHMWKDVRRRAERHRISFGHPTEFPRRSLLATRVSLLVEHEPWIGELSRRVYRANFVEDRTIDSVDVIGDVLRELSADLALSIDPAELLARAEAPETKQRLRERTDEAMARGIFGAPTVFVGDGELYWGDDRLEDAIDAAVAASGRAHVPVMSAEEARAFMREWIEPWNAGDLEAILAHYADHIEQTSPLVVERFGRADGTVVGKGELRAYFSAGLAAAKPKIHFEAIDAVPGVDGVAMIYKNQVGTTVVEVVELDHRKKIVRARVHR
jgi:2-hydroxychromene-2-carboxylate isomerase